MQDILSRIGVDINIAYYLVCYLLVWVRVLSMLSVIPFLFAKPVPRYVVVAVSMVLAAFIYPYALPDKQVELTEDKIVLVALFLKELFYGLMIGTAVSIIFQGYSAVGQMIDSQRGMSIARLLIPQLSEQGSISSMFLFLLGVVVYLTVGGHCAFFDAFFMSYKTLPILEFPLTGADLFPAMDLFMRITAEVIYMAMQLSAPIIIAIFIADIVLGIANRMAPQIDVWSMGFTIKGYVGILLLFVAMTAMGEQFVVYGDRANSYASQMIDLLGKKEILPPLPEPPPEEGMPKIEDGAPAVESR